jgi:hypothetical protein
MIFFIDDWNLIIYTQKYLRNTVVKFIITQLLNFKDELSNERISHPLNKLTEKTYDCETFTE